MICSQARKNEKGSNNLQESAYDVVVVAARKKRQKCYKKYSRYAFGSAVFVKLQLFLKNINHIKTFHCSLDLSDH